MISPLDQETLYDQHAAERFSGPGKSKLPDETEVHFYSCHKCEEKWWNRDGKQLSLSEVLELARKQST